MTEPVSAETVPADLLAAFAAYERAILANDLDVLDASFAPADGTMRGDAAGLLVGHEAISASRRLRPGGSSRPAPPWRRATLSSPASRHESKYRSGVGRLALSSADVHRRC